MNCARDFCPVNGWCGVPLLLQRHALLGISFQNLMRVMARAQRSFLYPQVTDGQEMAQQVAIK